MRDVSGMTGAGNASGRIACWLCSMTAGVWQQVPLQEVDYLCSPVDEAVAALSSGNAALVAAGDVLAVRAALGVGVTA